MAIRQYQTGRTYSLAVNFFDEIGTRTPVDSPTLTIYTPYKTIYSTPTLIADPLTIGKYYHNFYVATGLTFGHWFALGAGITANTTTFTEAVPFEIINLQTEPFWVGLTEFREYLGESDNDHTKDNFYKQILQASIELVEAYTRRTFGVRGYSEVIEIQHVDRVKLKRFPVISITALTATSLITPRTPTSFVETISDTSLVPFYYRTDLDNGLLKLTDSGGFDSSYNDVLLAITYEAGFLNIPEPIRHCVFMLASKLANMATSEGIETVSLADLNFALQKDLISGSINDILSQYKVVEI